jgi:hypothetical protein
MMMKKFSFSSAKALILFFLLPYHHHHHHKTQLINRKISRRCEKDRKSVESKVDEEKKNQQHEKVNNK